MTHYVRNVVRALFLDKARHNCLRPWYNPAFLPQGPQLLSKEAKDQQEEDKKEEENDNEIGRPGPDHALPPATCARNSSCFGSCTSGTRVYYSNSWAIYSSPLLRFKPPPVEREVEKKGEGNKDLQQPGYVS